MKTPLIIFAILLALPCVVFAPPLPDKDWTTCCDNAKESSYLQLGEPRYVQDDEYSCYPKSYTKVDENGNALPDDADWPWTLERHYEDSPLNPHFSPLRFRQASDLPDLSGLAWLGGDRFLAVHDAKVASEARNPRVSLLSLPADLKGVLWKPLALDFRGLKSNDLESAARIPGTKEVLLVESGDNLEDPKFQRIFKACVEGNWVRIIDVIAWPMTISNVEATAVGALGNQFVFLFAERAQNLSRTDLQWAVFDPQTLSFGTFRSVVFQNPNPTAFNRPLVAMDLDSSGLIYISSAFDAEAASLPNPDNGPFASAVYCIGELTEVNGEPEVILFDTPRLKGTLDGFKVESIAIRETDEYGLQIFVGFDDENYGATLRLLPPLPGN